MADPKNNIDMSSEAYTGFEWGKLDVIAQFPCQLNVAASRMGCSVSWINQCVKAKYGITWKEYNKMRTQEYLMPLAQKSVEKNLRRGNPDITKFILKNNTDYQENPEPKPLEQSDLKDKKVTFVRDRVDRDNPLE